MKKAAALLLNAVLCAGCSHTQVNASSGLASNVAASSAGGTSISSGAAGLHVQSDSSALATAIVVISLLAGAIELSREDPPTPGRSPSVTEGFVPAPQMAPERRVNEQDCSKPVDFFSGNLRCK